MLFILAYVGVTMISVREYRACVRCRYWWHVEVDICPLREDGVEKVNNKKFGEIYCKKKLIGV